MAGFLLMDVDWQATGSRSELWDRRQDCDKNRMGAQALSRAREEVVSSRAFVSLWWQIELSSRIYQAFAAMLAGFADTG